MIYSSNNKYQPVQSSLTERKMDVNRKFDVNYSITQQLTKQLKYKPLQLGNFQHSKDR